MPPSHSDMQLKLLADGWRHAARRSSAELDRWVRSHAHGIEELYEHARADDQQLLAELRSKDSVRRRLLSVAREAWRNSGVSTDSSRRVRLSAQVLLFDCGLGPAETAEVTRMVGYATPNEAYRALLSILAEVEGHMADRPLVPGKDAGLFYLNTTLGDAASQARDLEAAVVAYDRAWELRALLVDSREAVAGIAYSASRYGSSIAKRPRVGDAEELGIAFARLANAREKLVENAHRQHGLLALNTGITWNELLARAARDAQEGVVEKRFACLEQAWVDYQLLSGLNEDDILGAPDALPPPEKAAMSRLISDWHAAASLMGDTTLAEKLAEWARCLNSEGLHYWRVRLNDARFGVGDKRILAVESVLHDVDEQLQHRSLSESQRRALLKWASATAYDHRRTYRRRKGHGLAAWYWNRQAREWEDQLGVPHRDRLAADELAAADEGPGEGRPAVPSAEAGADSTKLDDHIQVGNGFGVAFWLLKLARRLKADHRRASEAEVEAIRVAAEWNASRRPARSDDRINTATNVSSIATVLGLAEQYAEGYAPDLLFEIPMELVRLDGLDPLLRKEAAERAYRVCVDQVRRADEVEVLVELLELDPDHAEDWGNRLFAALGAMTGSDAASLVATARNMLALATRGAAILTGLRLSEQAFSIAAAPLGTLQSAFQKVPDLVEEFELVEQWHAKALPDDGHQLFDLMRARRREREPVPPPPEADLPSLAARVGARRVVVVQFVMGGPTGSIALGATVERGHTRYWGTHLRLDAKRLENLRRAVSILLRPGQEARCGPYLHDLYRLCFAPIEDELAGADVLVMIPHGGFGALPLHAAEGPDGALARQRQITYLSALHAPDASNVRATPAAYIGGWDPEIDAGREGAAIADLLTAGGLQVDRPKTAKEGRKTLLHDSTHWGLLHIAAHGELRRWPHSSQSTLHLSSRISFTAADLARSPASADFGFINACSIGQFVPHAGDLNGFPLALRLRGVRSEIGVLSEVAPAAAHNFALTFYGLWKGDVDSLQAYRETCRIVGGAARDWAPYYHHGLPIRRPGESPVKPPPAPDSNHSAGTNV